MTLKKEIFYFLLTISAALSAFFVFVAARWYVDNRLPAFEKSAIIRVRPDTDSDELLRQVDSLLKPVRPKSLRRAFEKEAVSHHLCPGSYIIDTTFSARRFARVVTRGWENPVNLVLSGRMRSAEDIAGRISRQMMVDSVSMLAAFRNVDLLSKVGCSPESVLYLVLPDTYQMYWTATPEVIVERLKAEHDVFWNAERIEAARKQGLTPDQVTVLASIVAEESSKADEYPKIASVYLTRLRKGMKLQACPTICYLLNYSVKRVLKRHLEIDSPYNTYKYAGLPPAPIRVPGKDHIDAVLHPDSSQYLYFCADASLNGRNVFARTYTEHIDNAARYHKAITEYMAMRAANDALADSLVMQVIDKDLSVEDE